MLRWSVCSSYIFPYYEVLHSIDVLLLIWLMKGTTLVSLDSKKEKNKKLLTQT